MIIGSERLDDFCRALDNFLDDERDGEEKAKDLVRELARKVGVFEPAIWCVHHAWEMTRARRIAAQDMGRVILDFACGFDCSFGIEVSKLLHFWGVKEFTYSCNVGGACDACFGLQGGLYQIDGVCQIVKDIGLACYGFNEYAFHFSKIKQ